jgi:hypothetical protein
MQDPASWARTQWGAAELGDRRRTERAVRLGTAIAAAPARSLPAQMDGDWADTKAAYRLLDSAPVTHDALTAPHRAATRQHALAQAGPVLLIQDTTSLDLGRYAAMAGRGPIGDGRGQGLLVHSCLAVAPVPDGHRLLGLAAQLVWARPSVGRKQQESQIERQSRARESAIWAQSLAESGRAPATACWVSVGDAESDIFGCMRQARAQGYQYLLRVAQNRRVTLADGTPSHLFAAARAQPARSRRTVQLGGRGGQPARAVELAVSWTALTVRAPRHNPSEREAAALPCWCVRAWGEDLEWVLLTSVPVEDADAASERLDWYAGRWLIEEYHKGLKTGCAIERRRLQHATRLTALLGFLAIVAVRLLQGREASHHAPDAPVHGTVPAAFVALVAHRHEIPTAGMTQRQFWHAVAKLGGFLGRKGDGEPGWQTLWAGLYRLQDMADALAIPADQRAPPIHQAKCG